MSTRTSAPARRWRVVSGLALLAAMVASGCGLIGGESAAPEYSDAIGSAVTTTETTVPTTESTKPDEDPGALYRALIENSAPSAPVTTQVAAAAPEFCLQIQIFVFESTQMLLTDDIGGALDRYGAALTALDMVIGSSPVQIAEPAAVARGILVSTLDAPGTTAELSTFRQRVTEMVAGEFAQVFDGLFIEAAALCGNSLSDPYVGAEQGVRNVTGQ